jgi:predicted phage tail protein
MTSAVMCNVHFMGELGEKFGKKFRLQIATPAEALRALIYQIPDLRKVMRDGNYQVLRVSKKTTFHLGEEHLTLGMGRATDLVVVPVMEGAKSGSGIGKIIAGVVLIAASIVTAGATAGFAGGFGAAMSTTAFTAFGTAVTFGQIAGMGVMMALGGIASMFSASGKIKQPKYSQRADVEDKPSFIFSQPVNVTSEGATIPVVYGKFITGSVVVSAGIQSEELPD